MNLLRIFQLEEGRKLSSREISVVVILVRNGETEDQAWLRHLMENPMDHQADIKIYHIERA